MTLRDATLCAIARNMPRMRAVPWFVPWVTNQFARINLGRRNGRLHGNPAWLECLRATLRPMDIILTRSAYRFSDRVIPSFFTHAAVYVGGELPAWFPPAGHREAPPPDTAVVLEAVRSGVHLTALEAATDADILVALRDPSLVGDRRDAVRLRIPGELGKEYDFWLDERDDERIFCSQLVARLFAHLPSEPAVERPFLTLPDDIARLVLAPEPALAPVVLIDDNGPVDGAEARASVGAFLGRS
jgi:hypothetical protein